MRIADEMELKGLIGKTVKHISIGNEKTVILLVVDGAEDIFLTATGGCCSSSWFEHISGIDALVGHPIWSIEERPMPEEVRVDGEWGERSTKFYGWTFTTENGRFDIEMRNESNGYYGGEMNIGKTPLDQYHSEFNPEGIVPLTEDF